METIRAKFRVHDVVAYPTTGEQAAEQVQMSPVYSPDKTSENYAFFKATPNGNLHMWIDNPQAFGFFQRNAEYFLEFTRAPVYPEPVPGSTT